ncbi:MAG: hypothetical protein QOJ03_2277, partial [Frankiaceae bacterium]|nr:hypothetical protein [Frankiaceae bacterium]
RDVTDGTSGDGVVADLESIGGRAFLVFDHSQTGESHTVTRHQ